MAKTASKTRQKPAPKEEAPQPILQARVPIYGERVRRSGSDMEYEITWVSPDNLRVHIGIPRTNFEHRNVDAAILTYLDEPIPTAKPTKAVVNAPEVMEHVAAVHHSVLDHLSGELAVLKKYLKAKHVPADAGEELDTLCKEHEEAWKIIVAKIKELLGE